jgi:hypothetical protein
MIWLQSHGNTTATENVPGADSSLETEAAYNEKKKANSGSNESEDPHRDLTRIKRKFVIKGEHFFV